MKRVADTIASVVAAALLWVASAGVAAAHDAHAHHDRHAERGFAAAQMGGSIGAEMPAAEAAGHKCPESPAGTDHCASFHCHTVPALTTQAQAVGPDAPLQQTVLFGRTPLLAGALPDPPRRPPRTLS